MKSLDNGPRLNLKDQDKIKRLVAHANNHFDELQ